METARCGCSMSPSLTTGCLLSSQIFPVSCTIRTRMHCIVQVRRDMNSWHHPNGKSVSLFLLFTWVNPFYSGPGPAARPLYVFDKLIFARSHGFNSLPSIALLVCLRETRQKSNQKISLYTGHTFQQPFEQASGAPTPRPKHPSKFGWPLACRKPHHWECHSVLQPRVTPVMLMFIRYHKSYQASHNY
ncbi:hypothetical protein BD779DRAFT_452124 [Infundibulicybe gibba]|nr:hypothetical protein BD779DRAFT_452124 [Infundibulicybe gibba]